VASNLDSSSYANGRPIIFADGPSTTVGSIATIYTSQNDGLGTFAQVLVSVPGAPTFGSLSLRSEVLPGSNNRAHVIRSYVDGTDFCPQLIYQWVSAINILTTIDSRPTCQGSTRSKYFVHVVARSSDSLPFAVYAGASTSGFTTGSVNLYGAIEFTEFLIRNSGSGNRQLGTFNAFTKLSNGGYGLYYFNSDGGAGIQTYDYSYTNNVAGTSGWVHQVAVPAGTNQNGRGIIGVDGLGFVFIAHIQGDFNIAIRRGVDVMGTSFVQVQTFSISGCSVPGIDRTRTILLADNTPAFLLTCLDNRIYFIKCTTPSAAGTWTFQLLVVSGGAIVDSQDPTPDISLHLTSGVNKPHFVYTQSGTFSIVFVQSLLTTSF
jgi:hypothetical protein